MTKFKVGDWVVLIESNVFDGIEKVIEQDIGSYYMKWWRHATSEEIKAGKRLP